MPTSKQGPAFDQFLATADAVAKARPDVDLATAQEVFHEVATLLHNSLALDGRDEHDTDVVVAGLCVDLVASDSGASIRARSQETVENPSDLHDPEGARAAYLAAAAVMQLRVSEPLVLIASATRSDVMCQVFPEPNAF